MFRKFKLQSGATLLELVIFMSIALLLFGYVTLNLTKFQKKTSINTTIDTLVSDLKSQQTKAMSGAKSGANGSSYGVYFLSDRYILFTGSSYSGSSPSNFTVMLDGSLAITDIAFPGNTLVFLRESGEVSGFLEGGNRVAIQSTSGNEKLTITVNKYGVVTQIN